MANQLMLPSLKELQEFDGSTTPNYHLMGITVQGFDRNGRAAEVEAPGVNTLFVALLWHIAEASIFTIVTDGDKWAIVTESDRWVVYKGKAPILLTFGDRELIREQIKILAAVDRW